MKTKFLCCSIFLFLLLTSARAQDEKRKFVFLEGGIDFISCESPDKEYIRGDNIDPYYYGYMTDQLRSLLHMQYLGIKYEYRLSDNLIGVSAGLRYTRAVSTIGRTTYWSDTPEFFYVLFRQDGTTTEYAKVREIMQKSSYLGLPLEFRIYPYKDYAFNVYYKIGASFNVKISDKTDIVFFNEAMEEYHDEVSLVTEEAEPFYASIHLGIGLKFGKLPKPGGNLEFCLPIGILPARETSFVAPQAGAGFQALVRIPF